MQDKIHGQRAGKGGNPNQVCSGFSRGSMKDICICILAHNEQKHIAETIEAIAENCADLECDIKVYANGCTDATVAIVRDLALRLPNLSLRELDVASKPNAWNTAFHENANPILVFSDGDVIPEAGAIEALWRLVTKEQPETILAGCSIWPRKAGLTLGQRFVGLLQIPLKQTFLAGGLYAVRKTELLLEMQAKALDGIPLGIVGEDAFLEQLVPADKFNIIAHKVYYEPPILADYWKYLARMRWQEEQLAGLYHNLLCKQAYLKQGILVRVGKKKPMDQSVKRFLLGVAASGLRCVVKAMFRGRINRCYGAMGLVNKDGKNILSEASRSSSAK